MPYRWRTYGLITKPHCCRKQQLCHVLIDDWMGGRGFRGLWEGNLAQSRMQDCLSALVHVGLDSYHVLHNLCISPFVHAYTRLCCLMCRYPFPFRDIQVNMMPHMRSRIQRVSGFVCGCKAI